MTDIDDKIILRARRNKLLADYAAEARPVAQARADVSRAVAAFDAKLESKLAGLRVPKESRREEEEREELLKQQEHKVSSFAETKAKISSIEIALASDGGSDVSALLSAAAEPLAEMLDEAFGANVTDVEVFNAHAREYEAEFVEDMHSLGVRMPDALTRVTEYVPQVRGPLLKPNPET